MVGLSCIRAIIGLVTMAVLSAAGQTESVSALRQSAASAFENGRPAEAENVLRRLLKQSPDDPAALGFLGAVLDAQQKYEEAERVYLAALRLGKPSPALLNNLGNHYVSRKLPEKARPYFEKLVAADPAHQNANLQLARIAAGQKQGSDALKFLSRVRSQDPAVLLLRGEALFWGGKRADAVALLEKLGQNGVKDLRLQFSLGMAYARLEQYERAEDAFSRALVLRPDDHDILSNLGRAAARAGHYDRAQRALEVAARIRPDDVETLFELGRVHVAREDYGRAIYLLAAARKLSPKHTGVLLALARTSEDAGYYGDSAQIYDEYLALQPSDDLARRDRALVYGLTSVRLDEGLKEMEWYLKKHPEDPLAYYNPAIFYGVREPEKALEYLDKALNLDPSFSPAHYARAVLLNNMGRTAESVPNLEAAIRGNPKDYRPLDQLGLTYLALEKPAEAERVLRQALALAPEEPVVLMHLGRALIDLGREEEGQKFLNQFQAVNRERAQSERQNPGVIEFATLSPSEQRRRYAENLRKFIQTRPNDLDLKLRLARLLLSEGDLKAAEAAFRDLLESTANSRQLHNAGTALLRAKQFALARSFLERAAAERSSARPELAVAVFFTEGPEQALKVLGDVPSGEQTGDYLLVNARILDGAGRTDDAAKVLNEGLRYSTTRPEVAREAAVLLVRRDRTAEALALLDQTIRSAPDDPDLLLARATVLALLGRGSECEAALRQIQSRWPEWDRPFVVHGLWLEARKRTAEARKRFQTALALTPEDLTAKCALKRLEGVAVADPECACSRGLYEQLVPGCERH